MSTDGGLLGVPETRLPVDPAAARLGAGESAETVAAAYPSSSLAWALLAEQALGADRPVAGYMFVNYEGVLKVDGGVGNKKQYDPRAWGKVAEEGLAARVVEACQNLRSAGTHV